MDLGRLRGSRSPSPPPPHSTPPHPWPLSGAGIEGDTSGEVMIGLKGWTHDWLQEETFLFLNLDQWKPFIFISDLFFFKFATRVYGFPGSSPSSGALFRSLFRNMKRSDWLLKLEMNFDWLTNGKLFFFSLIGCRCSAGSNSFSLLNAENRVWDIGCYI